MNIDWDDVANEAADSPRSRLLQALDEAEDMVSVLIVYESRTEEHLASVYEYKSGLKAGAASASLLGLATWAQAQLLESMVDHHADA